MKKIALIAALGVSLLSGFRSEARVNINVSFGTPVMQPPWYSNDNDYIYMPDQGVYFNTHRQVYVFQDGGRWFTARQLPSRFGRVSYMNVRTVRMHDFRPFERDFDNRRRFAMAQRGGFRGDDRRDMNRFDEHDRNNGNNGRFDNRNGFDSRDGRDNRFDNRNSSDNNFGRGRR